jgi:hypothetical protein
MELEGTLHVLLIPETPDSNFDLDTDILTDTFVVLISPSG